MKLLKRIQNNKEIFVLIIISCLGVIAGSLLAPIESIFISSLTSNKILLGLAFSIGTICIFLFSIFIGRKSAALGKKKFILMGLVIGALYPIIYATSLNVFQYMFGRTAWALAVVLSGVMINSLFQDLVAKKKNIAEIFGWRFSLQSICGTLAALGGGAIADHFGLKAPYLIVIFVYLLALALFIIFVYNKTEGAIKEKKVKQQSVLTGLRDIINNPFLFLRMFLEGITQSHWAMEPILFPLIIYGLTGKNFYTGLVFGLMGVAAMIIFPAVGRYVDKKSPVKGFKIAFIYYTLGLFVLAMSKNLYLFIIGALILSLGKAMNGASSSKIETQNIKTERRGEYLSYINAYDTLTAALASFIIGLLLVYFSPHAILLIFALFTGVGGFIGFLIFKKKLIITSR